MNKNIIYDNSGYEDKENNIHNLYIECVIMLYIILEYNNSDNICIINNTINDMNLTKLLINNGYNKRSAYFISLSTMICFTFYNYIDYLYNHLYSYIFNLSNMYTAN